MNDNINSEDRIEVCQSNIIHNNIIEKAREEMPDEEILYDMAELFKIFGDTTRIRILYALSSSEMCVCDIATLLNMTQSAISHQLRLLKQASLVKYRRSGRTVYYSLCDDHIKTIFEQGLSHVQE